MRTEAQRRASRRYYERNKDRINAAARAWDKAHPEAVAARNRRWHKDHPSRSKQRWATAVGRVYSLKSNATHRGVLWSLPRELALDLVTDLCFYCHAEPSPFNGIDRVDNARGYEYGNVVTACWWCNRAKGTQTREQFEQHATRVARIANA